MVTGGGTTSPPPWLGSHPAHAAGGQGESSLQPSRAGEKNHKIRVELEKSPPGPPRQQAGEAGGGAGAAWTRPKAGTLPAARQHVRAERAACCQQQTGPAPPRPSLAQLPAGEAEGTGRGPEHPSVLLLPLALAGGGAKAHGPGAAWARGGSTPEKPTGEAVGQRFGEKWAGFCPSGTSQPHAEPAARPLGMKPPGPSPPVLSPRARSSPAPTLTRPRQGFCLFFFLLMDTK